MGGAAMSLTVKISHCEEFTGMVRKLQEKLRTDLSTSEVNVETIAVPSDVGVKTYKIVIEDKIYFDWSSSPRVKCQIKAAPSTKWVTPVNFDTHGHQFGPGLGVTCAICNGTGMRGLF